MAALKTYDPKTHDIVFAGILINEGLADGTFLSVTPDVAGFSVKVGADGEVTRTRMHNDVRTATVTVMQTSEVNQRLSALYNADRRGVNGEGVGVFFVQDRVTGSVDLTFAKSFISQDPDVVLEPEATTRDWTFILTDGEVNHNGSPDN